MGAESLAELVDEVRKAARSIEQGDTRTNQRIDVLQKALDALCVRMNRPGADTSAANDNDERKDATDLCILKHALSVPKDDGLSAIYAPSPAEIDQARAYRRGLRALWRHGDPNKCDNEIRKSLTSFSFGSNQFILPPQLATEVLSCLADETDVAGMVNVVQISAGSAKFFLDNVRLNLAAWACEASCFANNPQPDLAQIRRA
jgi:HK97 family phage major capsid protein